MIYIKPQELWEKFETNKTILPGHYLTCAENDEHSIRLSIEEGDLLLSYEGTGGYYDEAFDNEADAIAAYEEMLSWFSEEEDDPDEDSDTPEPPEVSDQLLAATAAWLCVAMHCKPKELNMSEMEIENFACNMLWELGIEEGETID